MQTVLLIPTGWNTFLEGERAGDNAHVPNDVLQIDSVKFDVEVDDEEADDPRRAVGLPRMSHITIVREVDLATASLTRYVLTGKVSKYPWEIRFISRREEGLEPFLVLRLFKVLIINHTVEFNGDGSSETLEVMPAAVEWEYLTLNEKNVPIGRYTFKFNVQKGTLS